MNAGFDTSNRTYADIISNSKQYVVPVYQRDYSWEGEQWGDLWDDLMEIQQQSAKDREAHYMGYLVLQQEYATTFKIIDGQQRLTTLSLLILAGLQILKSSDVKEDADRAELIKHGFISVKSAESLAESYKLQLNRNNDSYYRNDLASLSAHPAKGSIKATQRLMRKAKEFFEKKMRAEKWDGQALSAFIETVVARYLLFTVISVGEEVNAYKVFETLNARGVKLSTPDLLKNYLFSVIDPKARDERLIQAQEEKWGEILERLGGENFSKFLRAFWNSKEQLVKKNQLFKKLRDSITAPSDAIDCLSELREAAEVYAALRDKNSALWRQETSDKNRRESVRECVHVLKIFNIVQPLPILLRVYLTCSFDEFVETCRYLTAFCTRYHAVCSMPPQDMENIYNKIAIAVAGGKQADFIKQALLKHMPDDERFHDNFKYKEMPRSGGAAQAVYLLSSIESALSASNPLLLENAYTIEHILPEKGSGDDDYWYDQFGDSLEAIVNRLGNLTLLQEKDNRAAGCKNFAAKKAILGKSNLQIVQKLMQYDDWTPENLDAYQHWLADQAVEIWKL